MLDFPLSADIHRYALADLGGRELRLVRSGLPCALVPASRADQLPAYARQADYVILFPHWVVPELDVAAEDELRLGRATPRAPGDATPQQRRFRIEGVRRFEVLGIVRTEAFAVESRA